VLLLFLVVLGVLCAGASPSSSSGADAHQVLVLVLVLVLVRAGASGAWVLLVGSYSLLGRAAFQKPKNNSK
jgi:hypothetical protein